MQALQLERLQKQLKWVEEKSLYYQQKFAKAGVSAKDVQSLEDIRRLPFLTSNELFQVDSLDLLTLPLSGILRFSAVQQENGEVTKLYTNGDIAHNVEMMTRSLVAAGINQTSVVALQGDMSDSRSMDIVRLLPSRTLGIVESCNRRNICGRLDLAGPSLLHILSKAGFRRFLFFLLRSGYLFGSGYLTGSSLFYIVSKRHLSLHTLIPALFASLSNSASVRSRSPIWS